MSQLIHTLYKKIGKDDLHDWMSKNTKRKKYNFYSSIDIRHSGYKASPVDVNLFPGGFNNLSKNSLKLAASIIKNSYRNKKFLILPEEHTRNSHYNDNLMALKTMLELSGNQAVIGHNKKIFGSNGNHILTSPIKKIDKLIETQDGYVPDIILINNDMISGIPDVLQNIHQEIIPKPSLGWFNRSKSRYFQIYDEIVEKFCKDFSIDGWLINTFTSICTEINFNKQESLECIALKVEKILKKIQKKYDEYSIKDKPYVFIKADNGSYGMGVTNVFSAEEIFHLNKNVRKKMNVTKGKAIINKVLLQEGVATINVCDGYTAEPLVYCIMDQPISFLYRYHTGQCNLNNLNKVGAQFKEIVTGSVCNDKLAFFSSLITGLPLLATSIELEHYGDG
ncbi:MAG: glutamate--cysteine ligase [Rickettsiaceae bacterium H1]|nr:glutamate--cysteine ligase [Rickettsiaceae bacterium H1]